jgi:ribosomal protein S18 acetylase RimI-like enzyme
MRQAGPIEVRMASSTDLDALVNFSAAMAMETEARRLDRDRLRGGVLAVLESPAHGFYLVGERHDAGSRSMVGQLLVTYEWSDWRNANFWWIQSVYVDPAWRRQGVYRQLYSFVLESAKRRADVCGLRLYVEQDNHVAQSVYRKLELQPTKYHIWEVDFVL